MSQFCNNFRIQNCQLQRQNLLIVKVFTHTENSELLILESFSEVAGNPLIFISEGSHYSFIQITCGSQQDTYIKSCKEAYTYNNRPNIYCEVFLGHQNRKRKINCIQHIKDKYFHINELLN